MLGMPLASLYQALFKINLLPDLIFFKYLKLLILEILIFRTKTFFLYLTVCYSVCVFIYLHVCINLQIRCPKWGKK